MATMAALLTTKLGTFGVQPTDINNILAHLMANTNIYPAAIWVQDQAVTPFDPLAQVAIWQDCCAQTANYFQSRFPGAPVGYSIWTLNLFKAMAQSGTNWP